MWISSLRPERTTYDSGDTHWRGGQIRSLVSGTATVQLFLEANLVGTRTCSTTLLPAGAQVVGCPIAARVDASYAIQEVVGSFSQDRGPRNDALDITKGIFHLGVVPRDITGEPTTWWTGDARD